jgi:5'(3')-deoxyribonucleotidase
LIVLLDCDGVLAHFTAGAHRWASSRGLGPFTDEQITEYDIMKSFGVGPENWESFRAWLTGTRFCREAPVFEGAQAFVEELRKLGDVVIVTAPFVGVDHWEADRRDWLKRHFGFGHKDVISAHRKEVIRGHVLIDDSLDHCEAFVSKSTYRRAVLVDRPYNRHRAQRGTHVMARAKGYAEVLKALAESSP